MDLNYLYHRRGHSLMMANCAASEPARQAHLGLVRGYDGLIADRRRNPVAELAA